MNQLETINKPDDKLFLVEQLAKHSRAHSAIDSIVIRQMNEESRPAIQPQRETPFGLMKKQMAMKRAQTNKKASPDGKEESDDSSMNQPSIFEIIGGSTEMRHAPFY